MPSVFPEAKPRNMMITRNAAEVMIFLLAAPAVTPARQVSSALAPAWGERAAGIIWLVP